MGTGATSKKTYNKQMEQAGAEHEANGCMTFGYNHRGSRVEHQRREESHQSAKENSTSRVVTIQNSVFFGNPRSLPTPDPHDRCASPQHSLANPNHALLTCAQLTSSNFSLSWAAVTAAACSPSTSKFSTRSGTSSSSFSAPAAGLCCPC